MTVGPAVAVFILGAAVSLATSWVLVTRLERGPASGWASPSESRAWVAALAADAPEITASITALAHHQQTIGAGVVLGSNVFNLAALLSAWARLRPVGSRCTAGSSFSAARSRCSWARRVSLSVGGQISAKAGL